MLPWGVAVGEGAVVTAGEWVTVALQAVAAVVLGVRTAIEARAGRRSAWLWGLLAAVFVLLLASGLHGARRG